MALIKQQTLNPGLDNLQTVKTSCVFSDLKLCWERPLVHQRLHILSVKRILLPRVLDSIYDYLNVQSTMNTIHIPLSKDTPRKCIDVQQCIPLTPSYCLKKCWHVIWWCRYTKKWTNFLSITLRCTQKSTKHFWAITVQCTRRKWSRNKRFSGWCLAKKLAAKPMTSLCKFEWFFMGTNEEWMKSEWSVSE